MMISTKKLADAVTARACDSCIKKRARWYCAADDAFLCQACDSSVHSANLLARRHERVRLIKTEPRSEEPLWHSGFKTKPRTPRKSKLQKNPVLLVPEMGQDDNSFEENDEQEQLLYRVPILDPFGESNMNTEEIESLLGKGLDFDMETLGFLDNCTGKESLRSCCRNTETVKLKEEEVNNIGTEIDITFEMNFDKSVANETCMENEEFDDDLKEKKKKNILLALNYEEVISAWTDKKTPWITGDGPPELDLNHCWPPACMDVCGRVDNYLPAYGEMGNITTAADGGREARVLRYREKRRRRLFSKKIRYEVRKLNAEKRPRMKGRFVKRSSNFAPT